MNRNRKPRPGEYRPFITNFREDYSSIRNANWISHHQHRETHRHHTDDTTAAVMTGIGIVLLVMLVVAVLI